MCIEKLEPMLVKENHGFRERKSSCKDPFICLNETAHNSPIAVIADDPSFLTVSVNNLGDEYSHRVELIKEFKRLVIESEIASVTIPGNDKTFAIML